MKKLDISIIKSFSAGCINCELILFTPDKEVKLNIWSKESDLIEKYLIDIKNLYAIELVDVCGVLYLKLFTFTEDSCGKIDELIYSRELSKKELNKILELYY